MRHWLKFAILGAALLAPATTSVAGTKSPKLAHCDGHHRRPANVYGSILPTVDPAVGTSTPASAVSNGVDVFPQGGRTRPDRRHGSPRSGDKPATQVPPIGAISPPTAYRSC